jgi:hypothetical protein
MKICPAANAVLGAHALVFPQMIGHGSAGRSYLYIIKCGVGLGNALLGRMGQILIIVRSGMDGENLTAGQRNAATSTS